MVGVYIGRRGPQPLGTVDFEEIEAKAKEKLKDYPGTKPVFLCGCRRSALTRGIHVCGRKRWYQFHLSRKPRRV
jgi:hypothetical protein